MRRRVGVLALCVLVVAQTAGGTSARVPAFEHVLVVVLENKERSEIVGNAAAPTFNRLARRYVTLANYDAVAHPSLPNYLALVSGSTHGIHSDCTSCVVRAPSLADTLERRGLTWRTYAEGIPRPGFEGAGNGRYAKKHDPFLYFADVASSTRRRDNVVPLRELHRDAVADRLPSFALVVPDQCDDMHSCPIATGDRWLRTHVVPLLRLRSFTRSVVFIVFDEGTTDAGGGGHVVGIVLGPTVKAHATFVPATNHYGLLRTVEAAWGLPLLGRSANAQPITGIWR